LILKKLCNRLLTGKTITNEADAIECMEMLHQMGVKVVIISSSVLGPNGTLTAFGSTSKYDFYFHLSKDCVRFSLG
jgi:pyridoxal/pyridoxine/pyridoxamine kinase